MTTTGKQSDDSRQGFEPEDVTEIEPESKDGDTGQAALGGRRAGPGSDQAGRPVAPQTGDPHGDDRQG